MNGRPCNYWINPMNTFQFGQKITLNENELATRWGISPQWFAYRAKVQRSLPSTYDQQPNW